MFPVGDMQRMEITLLLLPFIRNRREESEEGHRG